VPIFENSDQLRAVNTDAKKASLRAALISDANSLTINAKDPYFGGKELARTARLIEIADLLGEAATKEKLKNQLVSELDNFWFGVASQSPALVFEPTWGGLVSRKSVGNAQADFGQYYYNDHHFHYGYHVYAGAVLAKFYPDYYASRRQYYRILVADYAGM
jgi:endo-1,3(4)-beta-glucanase